MDSTAEKLREIEVERDRLRGCEDHRVCDPKEKGLLTLNRTVYEHLALGDFTKLFVSTTALRNQEIIQRFSGSP